MTLVSGQYSVENYTTFLNEGDTCSFISTISKGLVNQHSQYLHFSVLACMMTLLVKFNIARI